MWHVLTEKRHTGPEERQGVTTQPEGVRKISRADGFQAKDSEECSSAARNPEPGPVVGATESRFPQKDRCENRAFISLLDIKGGVDRGVDAGGEGWQRKGAGERG